MTIQESLSKLSKLAPEWCCEDEFDGHSVTDTMGEYSAHDGYNGGLLGAAIRHAEAEGLNLHLRHRHGYDDYSVELYEGFDIFLESQIADSPAAAMLAALVAYYESKEDV